MIEPGSSTIELKRIRAVVLDVDGVLTDGGLWWGLNGEEWKRFCFADIMGVSLARRAGFALALVSGEDSPLVDRFAHKVHIRHVVKGCRDKASALRNFAAETGIGLEQICFMGDDVNDLPAMQIAGLAAAPANGDEEVRARAGFVTKNAGGNGAVRELVDRLLASRGLSALKVFSDSLEQSKTESR
jgi:3-deoxy-D-manno-octulosonate 8-phosphate phosphatase (KDO 8-P phosphatase)